MDLKTKFKRSAICVGVRFVPSERPGSFSSLHNAAFTAPSIGTFVNNDSTSKDTMTSFSCIRSWLMVEEGITVFNCCMCGH